MLKLIGYAVLALVLAVVALAVYAALTRPDTFQVERRLVIKAPPDKLWPLVSDLKGFHQWNPFGAKDPNAKVTSAPTPPVLVRATLGKAPSSAWAAWKSPKCRTSGQRNSSWTS